MPARHPWPGWARDLILLIGITALVAGIIAFRTLMFWPMNLP